MDWQAKIIKNHSENAFEDLAFEVFRYQLEHCEVYADYVTAISRKIHHLFQIFLFADFIF